LLEGDGSGLVERGGKLTEEARERERERDTKEDRCRDWEGTGKQKGGRGAERGERDTCTQRVR